MKAEQRIMRILALGCAALPIFDIVTHEPLNSVILGFIPSLMALSFVGLITYTRRLEEKEETELKA